MGRELLPGLLLELHGNTVMLTTPQAVGPDEVRQRPLDHVSGHAKCIGTAA